MRTSGQHDSDTLLTQAQEFETLGNLDAARGAYRARLTEKPQDYLALTRLALLEYRNRAFDSAIALLHQADAAYPDDFDILYSLGVSYQAAGRMDESIRCFEKTIQLRPQNLQAYVYLSSAFRTTDRIDAALEVLERASQLQLLDTSAQCLYARLLEHDAENRPGLFDEAIQAYRASMRLNPGNPEPAARLSLLLERINRIDEAEETAASGLARTPDYPWLRLAMAKCRYRQQRYAEGIACLQGVNIFACPPQLQVLIGAELGALYDKTGAYDKAFESFLLSNEQAGKLWHIHNSESEPYIRKIQRLLEHADRMERTAPPVPLHDEHADPVFLIGFPRSGTTLLDQILNSHAGIHTLEEIPVFNRLLESTNNLDGRYPLALDQLSASEMAGLRSAYFDEIAKHTRIPRDAVFVDKLPLNIGNLLIINRLFPRARYLLAIRHPCDACLSCFMQSFRFNTAMASFYSLESTVQLYHLVMRLLLRFGQILDLDVHQVRYEDVVEDMEAETRRLLDFLGLEWDEAMQHFDRQASERLSIKTPSYRQVRQPIYRSSVYRWRNYRRYFEPFLPLLQPYIEEFRYSD